MYEHAIEMFLEYSGFQKQDEEHIIYRIGADYHQIDFWLQGTMASVKNAYDDFQDPEGVCGITLAALEIVTWPFVRAVMAQKKAKDDIVLLYSNKVAYCGHPVTNRRQKPKPVDDAIMKAWQEFAIRLQTFWQALITCNLPEYSTAMPKPSINFVICEATDIEELEELVLNYLQDGYTLHGSLSVSYKKRQRIYTQAVCKL